MVVVMKTNSVRGYKDNTNFIAIHICSLSVPFVVLWKRDLHSKRSDSSYLNNVNYYMFFRQAIILYKVHTIFVWSQV